MGNNMKMQPTRIRPVRLAVSAALVGHDVALDQEREQDDRERDEGRGRGQRFLVDLLVVDHVEHGDGEGAGGVSGQDYGEEEVVLGEDEA